jgi:peptidoglycan/LPS O-acetylase OafA/YrhL
MRYRSDVDGLRAVAVISVVLFHAGLPQFPGGFIGVDVFFVISGYLITTLILHDVAKGRFSIANFYERRVRRIFPALLAVLAFASVAGYLILLPADARTFGQSLVATTVFSSNLLFFQQTGYFDAAAETKPLLHTWSLAVEEQFYLLYPLLLLLIGRYLRKRYTTALLMVGGLSLAISIVGVGRDQPAMFYLAPPRAWELLLGGLLAIPALPPRRTENSQTRWGSWDSALFAIASFDCRLRSRFPEQMHSTPL